MRYFVIVENDIIVSSVVGEVDEAPSGNYQEVTEEEYNRLNEKMIEKINSSLAEQEQEEVEQEPTLKEIYEAIKATEATNDEILYNMLFASNEDVDK